MKGWKRHVIDLPVVGGAVLLLYRARVGFRYLWPSWRELGYWLVSSRETTNFTYDLTCLNRDYLAAFIAHIVRQPLAQVLAWFEELEGDTELRRHVRAVRDGSSGRRLLRGFIGRRVPQWMGQVGRRSIGVGSHRRGPRRPRGRRMPACTRRSRWRW